MKQRLDPLIKERAPWLFAGTPMANAARSILMHLLGYKATLALAEHARDRGAAEIMATLGTRIARNVSVEGLRHIPAKGPALVVANHPTGIADGIILNAAIAQIRNDAFFYANADILRVLPQMRDVIVPVEWRKDRRSRAKLRETMLSTEAAFKAGRLGVIFPSGRLAKRHGLSLRERPWMPSAATIARKYGLDVIPIHIRARNSALFYLLDALHPTLRDITLFHEALNKARQPFDLTIGPPIPSGNLPAQSDIGIVVLRETVLALGKSSGRPTKSVPARNRGQENQGLEAARVH